MDYIQLAESILFIIMTLGAIIYGVIKLIQEKSKEAKTDASEELIELKKEQDAKMVNFSKRLDELDGWRKDMNGQLKLMNERQQFTNSILTDQKSQLSLVTDAMNSVAKSLAVMGESVRNLKSTVDKQ